MESSALKQRFVLDTSLFITEKIREDDEDVEAAALALLDDIAEARLEYGISCYMPPSIERELITMLEEREVSDEVYKKLNTWVITKSPAHYEVMIPAGMVYEFIDEMSDRVNRGLRVSEKAVRKAEKRREDKPSEEQADDYLSAVDRVISDLRDEYRDALRQGVLDSREDFDLLILARELDAGVVTEDRGIIKWAEDFGLRYLEGRDFPPLLREYLAVKHGRYPERGPDE